MMPNTAVSTVRGAASVLRKDQRSMKIEQTIVPVKHAEVFV